LLERSEAHKKTFAESKRPSFVFEALLLGDHRKGRIASAPQCKRTTAFAAIPTLDKKKKSILHWANAIRPDSVY
jgi:hypothetical protein